MRTYQFWSRKGDAPWIMTEMTARTIGDVRRWAVENNVEIENGRIWRRS